MDIKKSLELRMIDNPSNMAVWEELVRVTKEEWDTSYVNDLPDMAFAIVLEGGEKDDEGKTVPRSLRKLPHHNSTVTSPNDDSSVDMPHLRNALARISQVEGATEAEIEAAQKHLDGHMERLSEES